MAKDKVRYRESRKLALGAVAVEKSIGITQLVSSDTVSPATEPTDSRLGERPTALMKWSFDDTIVEEVLPRGLVTDTAPSGVDARSVSALVRVVSEGVPDPVVERVVRSRLPRQLGISLHFLTPVDFMACSSRYVWVHGIDGPAVKTHWSEAVQARGGRPRNDSAEPTPKLVRTPSGEVWLDPPCLIRVPCDAPTFPLASLPHLRYTVVLRNVPGSLSSVLPRLVSLRDRGFLNYGHVARHGLGSLRAYEDGKALMQRDYTTFLQRYARSLSEGTPHVSRELLALDDALTNPRASRQDWQNVLTAVKMGLKQDREAIPRWEHTGLYPCHHDQLQELVRRAAGVAPQHHDSAHVIREAVPRRILQEKLRVVSEVHFNAQASLRWDRRSATAEGRHAPREVRIGDIVLAGDPASPELLDPYEGMADHIDGDMVSGVHQDWVYFAQEQILHARAEALASGRLKRVQTQSEAAAHTMDQVVLPLYGRGVEELPFVHHHPAQGARAETSRDWFHELARELAIDGLSVLRTAPLASFRPLVVKPTHFAAYLCDEQRGWDWNVGGNQHETSAGEDLKKQLYKDQEGITRIQSPLMALNGKNMIARRGIRLGHSQCGGDGDQARHHFLKPARKPGMLCVVRMELPRGSPVTSALREVFQFTTLSPTAIFHLLAHR